MMKVLLFLSFLIVYGLWTAACAKSVKKVEADIQIGKSFWSGELLLLLGLAGFFGFIYLLSGLWSIKLVLLIILASHLGSLVAWVLNGILGRRSTAEAAIRGFWAGAEITIKHPVAMPVLWLLMAAFMLCYPIVCGIVLFHHPWASQVLQILVVKYSLLFLSLGGQLFFVILVWNMLYSENLDDDVRQRIFINQIGGLIPVAIYVALAFWAFGLGGAPLTLDIIGIPEGTLSLRTLLLLLVFFGTMVLVPYLVGTQRARSKNLELLKTIKGYVAETADILKIPTGSLYVVKLTALRDKILGARDQFVNNDALLTFDRNARENPDQVAKDRKGIVDAIGKSRGLDVRFRFLDDLTGLGNELEGIVVDLQKRTEATIEDAAEHWSKAYENRKGELDKIIETATSNKPLVTAGVGSMVMLIVSGVLGEVGKYAWQLITHAPK